MIQGLPLILAQHVVLEEIEQFAQATSYIYVAFDLDLANLKSHLEKHALQIAQVRWSTWDYSLLMLSVGRYKTTGVL